MDHSHNPEKTAWESSIAIPLAEDFPVPSGDGVHGCLAMCGPSQAGGAGGVPTALACVCQYDGGQNVRSIPPRGI